MADHSGEKTVWLQAKGKDGKVYKMQVHANSIQAVQQQLRPVVVTTEVEVEGPSVGCPRCSKEFYNHVALSNHLKLQHGVELSELPPAAPATTTNVATTPPAPVMRNAVKIGGQKTGNMLRLDKEQLISLATEESKYIIVKSEDVIRPSGRSKKVKDKVKGRPGPKPTVIETPVNMMGPFECLQRFPDEPDAVCHQVFFNCCEYSMHFRREHTSNRKPGLRCQVCEKNLDAVMAGLTEEDAQVQCTQCRIKLDDAESLAEHMRVAHVKPRPFRCTVCNKGFTQRGGLQQHMRLHTGDRPFSCDYCDKTFTQKSGLGQHIRIHTNDKPYRCVVCNKSFAQAINLKGHMRTHTQIRPHQCHVCQRRFKQGSQLSQHMQTHKNYAKVQTSAMADDTSAEYIVGTAEPMESDDQDTGYQVDTGYQADTGDEVCVKYEVYDGQVETDEQYYTVEHVEANEVQLDGDTSGSVYIQVAGDQVVITDNVETVVS